MPKRAVLPRFQSEKSKNQTTNARQQEQNENQIEDEMSQNLRSSSDISNEESFQNLENMPRRSIRSTTRTITTNESTNPNSRQENSAAGTSRRKTNKPSRRPVGAKALKEIKILQNTTNLLIPKMSFTRVVREICADLGCYDIRFTASSLLAIQEATETYLTIFLQDSFCTLHRDRKTLSVKDMRLVRYLRGPKDLGNI